MAQSAERDQHRELIRHAFAEQAAAFEDRRFNRVFTADSEWVFAEVPRGPQDLVLDVAAGTGHAARHFAADVRTVIAVDATAEMLRTGRAAAEREGHRNVAFLVGDAAALPFLDASFDIVVCRFALHHFERPEVQVAEMRRCLRSGGRLAVADLVSDPDPATATIQNELEHHRDASHTRMLTPDELRSLVGASGVSEPRIELRSMERPVEPWLAQTATPPAVADEIRARLTDELDGGTPTGFAPRFVDGELWFRQTFASCLAEVAGA
jgi:ubiquinone/menaquinone biosynthesis C-methylase UbiE